MNTTEDQPKTRKWTRRKIIITAAAGIFVTCCGLTGLLTLIPDSAEPEATAVSQQDRAVEIAIEEDNEPEPTATRRPTNTPRPTATDEPTATTKPTIEPTATETEQPKEATATSTATNTATPRPTNTPIPQPSNTAVPQPTNTPAPQPTATQPPAPTSPPAPTATQPPPPPTATQSPVPVAAPGDVQISFILYDGAVSRVESDEYAVITNNGGSPVNIGGWRLNAGAPGQDFTFPGFDLQPGQSCRVYTNESHPDTCGFSFGSGQAIWNNGGDCGYLFDNNGAQVSQRCY